MIKKVNLDYFKRFEHQEFLLGDSIVLAGPNNSGKSTLLQAIAVWNLGVQRWLQERGGNKSKAKLRTGVPISRKDFTAIPLREMDLLWADRLIAYRKDEIKDVKAGQPKLIDIKVSGESDDGSPWEVTVNIRRQSTEQVYVKLLDCDGNPLTELPEKASDTKVVHIPPFSGIGAEETRFDQGYQNYLVGQGKPGDVLRNLLLELFQQKGDTDDWDALKRDVRELFGIEIIDPKYSGSDPFIVIEYQGDANTKPLDLACAGSGFHQVLTLFSFIYARAASVLLIDEPDAHEHVILQRQVYDRLRSVARDRNCQLVISTHSIVILDNTSPRHIMSFYGKPHNLEIDTHRGQVIEALKRISSLDILAAESGQNILYVEDESDLKILTEFARVLGHRALTILEKCFFWSIQGSDAKQARAHFFGLRAVSPKIQGVVLLDGDNKGLSDHKVGADGLDVIRWARYEIENYLIIPEALKRFVRDRRLPLFAVEAVDAAATFIEKQLPPIAIEDPLGDSEFLQSIPASKKLLPNLFQEIGFDTAKRDYYQIAACMKSEEVHEDVIHKLDTIADKLNS